MKSDKSSREEAVRFDLVQVVNFGWNYSIVELSRLGGGLMVNFVGENDLHDRWIWAADIDERICHEKNIYVCHDRDSFAGCFGTRYC